MSPEDLAVIATLLQAPVEPPPGVADFAAWKSAWKQTVASWKSPIDRALAGGSSADRPAWAFAAGYQAAIQCLVPQMAAGGPIAAICITEEDGAHPARIRCRLTASRGEKGWRLDGTKTFVTGADGADILLVAASCGMTPDGRNRLRMVQVPADHSGILMSPLPALGFVPEIPHGQVRFEAVRLTDDALLPGDGYREAIKPFRTLEDIHVTGAFLAWLFAVGRRSGWPDATLETLVALMVTARVLAAAPPLEPHVHLALGGLLSQVALVVETAAPHWKRVDARTRQWWQRDRRILDIAAGLRSRRLETARARYRST
jgi:hypothetical protein